MEAAFDNELDVLLKLFDQGPHPTHRTGSGPSADVALFHIYLAVYQTYQDAALDLFAFCFCDWL